MAKSALQCSLLACKERMKNMFILPFQYYLSFSNKRMK